MGQNLLLNYEMPLQFLAQKCLSNIARNPIEDITNDVVVLYENDD
jgi:hypothetical protein